MKREIDVTNGPVFKNILLFSLPIMAMNLLQLLFNAADMIVVGNYSGSTALAAVGATGSLISLITNLFMGLSVGTSVVVSQDEGAGDAPAVSKAVHTSIFLGIVGGLFVSVLGFVVCKPLLRLMGTPEDILELSTLYMKIYFLGMPATMIYNFAAAVLRAVGDSKHPMYYLIATGVMNVVCNLLFVCAFGMDVDGVAWATVIAQYTSLALILACLLRSHTDIRLDWRKIRPDAKKTAAILRIGLPAGIQGVLYSISNVLIQSCVNSFGSAMVAASSTASNVESLVSTSMNAYNNAAITFTGQNVGAGKPERIDKVAKACMILVVLTWLILGGAVVLAGRPLLSLYTSDKEVIDLGYVKLFVLMCGYISCGTQGTLPGVTRGMGYSVLPMVCTLVGACLFRIVWVETAFQWWPTPVILFAVYPVSWTIASIGQIASFFYARRKTFEKLRKTV